MEILNANGSLYFQVIFALAFHSLSRPHCSLQCRQPYLLDPLASTFRRSRSCQVSSFVSSSGLLKATKRPNELQTLPVMYMLCSPGYSLRAPHCALPGRRSLAPRDRRPGTFMDFILGTQSLFAKNCSFSIFLEFF